MATFQNRIMARSPYYITATAGTPSAFGTITCTSVIATDEVVVNGLTYTGVSGVKADDTEFSIDTSDTACALDLADSITNDARSGTLNDVTAISALGVVTATQTVAGTGGNATTLVSNDATMVVSGALFTGGGDGVIETATLVIYIWEGSDTTPTTATYTISKDALTSTSSDITFEISGLIRDFFIHNADAYQVTPDNYADALWVETELDVTQEGTNPSTINNIYIAMDGYSQFDDGVNYVYPYQADWDTVPTIRVETGQPARLPFYVSTEALDGVWKVVSKLDGVAVTTIDYTATKAVSANSYDRIVYFEEGNTVDEIELHYTSTKSISIPVVDIDECKYNPRIVSFINREGLLQNITMFKVSKNSIKTKRSSYKKILGSVGGSSYSYDTNQHQYQDYEITGKISYTLNSDFMEESENCVLKQLLMSEYIWIDQVPVTIPSNNLDFQTNINDKLINYTLNFEAANDIINHV